MCKNAFLDNDFVGNGIVMQQEQQERGETLIELSQLSFLEDSQRSQDLNTDQFEHVLSESETTQRPS